MLDESGDVPRMSLVPDVSRLILQGRCLISMSGRPEITARMLAKVLAGAGDAVIRPGVGGIIERTPHVEDPCLAKALRSFAPAARRLGLALNVIDPTALAGAEWAEQSLKDDLLPADAVGDRRGLADLRKLMREGFSPACRRTIEEGSRGRKVSSVDFILPYSPFATGVSFSNAMGRAYRNEIVRFVIAPDEARLLSSYREIALAFAQRYLGRTREVPGATRHVEEAFADAAAAILFVKDGGNSFTVNKMALLREAALSRWDGEGEAPPATHLTLQRLLPGLNEYADADIDKILADAASAATSNAPRSIRALEATRAAATADEVFLDLETCSAGTTRALKRAYQRDLDETLSRLAKHPAAVERFANFGVVTAPLGMEDVFDAAVAKAECRDTGLAARDAEVIGGMFDDAFGNDFSAEPSQNALSPGF
jgi:hypothetical protein